MGVTFNGSLFEVNNMALLIKSIPYREVTLYVIKEKNTYEP